MKIDFKEISIKATKTWKVDGKKRQETKKFYQTINPWNLNADGTMKTESQILEELDQARTKWLSKSPV
jgi:inner membrane protein involved in colicin E2 resistance